MTGALAATAGMFLPAFAFTLIGGAWIERAVEEPRIHAFLDGVTAAVVGIVAAVVVELARHAFVDLRAVIAAALAGVLLWRWRSPLSTPAAILIGVSVGQLLG